MNIPSRAQAFAICHDCRLRHPCFSPQGFLDFQARHPGHRISYLDRDYLHEIHGSKLASWDPRKILISAFGAMESLFLRRSLNELAAYQPNSDIKEAFGTSTAITCTLASLANFASREATAIDNSSNLYLDAFIYFACTLQAGSPANDKAIYYYVYGSEDGTNFTDNATGSDADIAMRIPTNLRLFGVSSTPDSGGLTYKSQPMSAALAFGGVLPRKFGPVVTNVTGLTFSATEGSHTKKYSGVYATVI